ncbi:MAG: acyl-CoA dehydrogenase, partial [Promethearchaeota archaeon]
LLYNPMVKSWVTLQGDVVMNGLFDVISAKGFEKNTFFSMAKRDMRGQSKLEGTVHVNLALVIKFMDNYFFNHKQFQEVPKVSEAKNDDFLFKQPPTKGLRDIQFHDYREIYSKFDRPNIKKFRRVICTFKNMMKIAPPTDSQKKNFDFLLNIGKMFAQCVYSNLILETLKYNPIDSNVLDEIFEIIIKDFSTFALKMRDKPQITLLQRLFCSRMIVRPHTDEERSNRIWKSYIAPLKDLYEMNA